jgi:hypothetical protein
MTKPRNLPPGTPAPLSGEYTVVGPRGGRGAEVTVPKGYTLTRPARNASGKR